MPAAGEAPPARHLVVRLGAFLAELTSELPPEAVHAGIVDQMVEPGHDPRLSGVADAGRFTELWTALQRGLPLSAEAWHGVVLPTVVAFSRQQRLKSDLELATSHWMTASTVRTSPPQDLPEPQPELAGIVHARHPSAVEEAGAPPARPSVVDVAVIAPRRGGVRPPRRALAVTAAVAMLTATALLWWSQAPRSGDENKMSVPPLAPAGDGGQPAASPGSSPPATPAAIQPIGNTATAPLSTQPVPPPTWTGHGPVTAPTAPRDLAIIGVSPTGISLSWRPPADAGTGGLAYYRIWRDGAAAGWTTQSSATVAGLTPATSYAFTVTAHNGAGAASPPSNAVTGSTQMHEQQQGPQTPLPTPPTTQSPPPPVYRPTLATDPPQAPISLGRSFVVMGTGWPCTAPSTMEIYLGGQLVATADTDAQGAFRTTIRVDASQPATPTVPVIGGTEPLTLTRGTWLVSAQLPAQASCSATPERSIQITFR